MRIFNRWSIDKVQHRIAELDDVYSVMCEQPKHDRYLVHVWVVCHNGQFPDDLNDGIRQAVGRRPRDIKVDVILYRRDAS